MGGGHHRVERFDDRHSEDRAVPATPRHGCHRPRPAAHRRRRRPRRAAHRRRFGRRQRTPSPSPRRSCPTSATRCRCSPPSPATRPRPTKAALTSQLTPLLTAAGLGDRRLRRGRRRRHRGRPARPRRRRPGHPGLDGEAAHRRGRADHARPVRHPRDDGRRRRHARRGRPRRRRRPDAVAHRPVPDLPGRAHRRRPRHPGARRHAGRHAGHADRRRQLAVQRPADRERLGRGRRPVQLRRPGHRDRRRRRPGQPGVHGAQRAARHSTPARRWPTPSARAAPPSSSARRRPARRRWRTVHSAPISRLVEQALSMSDNMLAEALARQVAIARKLPASFEGSAQAVIAALTDAKLDVTGVTLSDGSGLSRDDRVPAVGADRGGRAAPPTAASTAPPRSSPGCRWPATTARSFDRGDAGDGARARCGPRPAPCWACTRWPARWSPSTGGCWPSRSSPTARGSDAAAEGALDDVAAALAGCGCR